ncbi:ommochrome-binding protein-like [Leptidea sinapis]|uniref:ommochrome-binding protein-like n=1 Tax=Leptidea sinapis TaxID=189913 RepID=UPI002143C863|nr:ommochrome-binding protein-like [Leptidea sinapis]
MRFLFTVTLLIAATTADKRCHGIYFDEKYFNLDIIKEGIHQLHALALNRNDNTAYFTFETLSQIPNRVLGYIELNTGKVGVIEGIRNATGIAIDQFYGKVYVGGMDGLYKVNDRKIPERLPLQDDVRSLFFKDGLYFINKNKQAYKFEDGYAAFVPELRGVELDSLILDDDNNIFFTQNKKLFRVKLGTKAINTHEMHVVDALTTDVYYKSYICTRNGVFSYNKYKYVYDKVSEIGGLKALAFNKLNEPIYAVADYIVKLRQNEVPCFED